MNFGGQARRHESAGHQRFRQSFGVVNDCPAIGFEARLEGLLKADCLAGDDVHQRTSLQAGEHHFIYVFCVLRPAHDHAGPRAAERLVSGGGHEVGDGDRAVVQAGSNEAGIVGHIDE